MGSTRCRIKIDPAHPYFLLLRELLKSVLTAYDYDPRFKRLNVAYRYYYYSKSHREMIIPVTTLKIVTDEFDVNAIPYEIKNEQLVKPAKITTKLNPDFKLRDNQKEYVDLIAK